jgi:hypothetical protein
MKYCCITCKHEQWRGFFPEQVSDWKYIIFHGLAIGLCGTATRLLFQWLGQSISGWLKGLASLGVCAVLLACLYVGALLGEQVLVFNRRCRACGARGLQLHT